MTAPTAPAPGFYPDPLDPSGERWWDGATWTETIRPAAHLADPVDPAHVVAGELGSDPDSPSDPDDFLVPGLAPEPQLAHVPHRAGEAVSIVPSQPEPQPQREPEAEFEPQFDPQLESESESELDSQPTPGSPDPVADVLTQPSPPGVPAGLYPDPYGQAPLRWWDGQQWTTRTSGEAGTTGAFVPAQGTPTAALPLGRGIAGRPTAPAEPGFSPAALRSRLAASRLATSRLAASWSLATSWRPGRRSLGVLLIVVVAAAAGVFFLGGRHSSDAPSPASLAAAVNLRVSDLPRGWVLSPASATGAADTSGASQDAANGALTRAVDRCSGAPDVTAKTFAASSAAWTRGTAVISSNVTALRTAALAQQGLQASQGTKLVSCLERVGTPALRSMLAGKAITLTGFSVTRLPGAPRDGFALRMKMSLRGPGGQALTVWTDSYGFVRGNVEVGLTMVGSGAAPDRAVAVTALKQLRTRSTTAIPLS